MSSTRPIKTVVATDGSAEQRTLESLLDDPGIEVVGVLEATATSRCARSSQADALLVACNGHSETALELHRRGRRANGPTWPVVVATVAAANGFIRQVFEAGADDIVSSTDSTMPGPETFFALQKAVARRSRAGRSGDELGRHGDLTVLGPKGGTGKTLTTTNLAVALADRGQPRRRDRPRPPVRRPRARARACRPSGRSTTSPPPAARWTPRRSTPTWPTHASGAADPARAGRGPTRRSASRSEFLRELYAVAATHATSSWSSTRRPGSRPRSSRRSTLDRHLHGRRCSTRRR